MNAKKKDKGDEKGDKSEVQGYQDPTNIVNVIFGGDSGFPTKRAQKLTLHEIMDIEPATPQPLRYSEVPISFSREDQWTSFSELGKFSLVLDLMVAGSQLTRVLINDGSSLNLLFVSTLKKMGLDITSMLAPTKSSFYGIIPRNSVIPIGSVTLPVTFGAKNNYCMEYTKFEVANFELSYNAILRRPALAKFMVVPHYDYLLLKMPGKTGVLTFRGDLNKSYNFDQEAIEYASTTRVLDASTEVFAAAQQLSQSEMVIPTKKSSQSMVKPTSDVSMKSIQLQEGDPSQTTLIGTGLGDK
jgi:hypothetical protein